MNKIDQYKSLPTALIPWYKANGRILPWRSDPTPYKVWISEIMLQQTRIETVIPYYLRFISELPDIISLAGADLEKLHKLWEGLGYYSRVHNLQKAAVIIMDRFDGEFPNDFKNIRSLSGIGDYTAGAIASICFNLPEPAVDGNVLRVICRITGDTTPISVGALKKDIRSNLKAVYPMTQCGIFTQSIMELGEIICIPNGIPRCDSCPCKDFCQSSEGLWKSIPVKPEKKERKKVGITVFVLASNGKYAIIRRDGSGLLSGMWEFPNVPNHLTDHDALDVISQWGCEPIRIKNSYYTKHIFTHIEWDIHCYNVECNLSPETFKWVSESELQTDITLPTAFRKLINL